MTEGWKPEFVYVALNVRLARDELLLDLLELLDDDEDLDDELLDDDVDTGHWRMSQPQRPSGSFSHDGPPMEPSGHCQLG